MALNSYIIFLIVEKCKKCYTISIGSVPGCEKSRSGFPENKLFHHKKMRFFMYRNFIFDLYGTLYTEKGIQPTEALLTVPVSSSGSNPSILYNAIPLP